MVQADRHRVKIWIMPLNRNGCGGGERASKTALRCRAEEIPWVCVGHVVMVIIHKGSPGSFLLTNSILAFIQLQFISLPPFQVATLPLSYVRYWQLQSKPLWRVHHSVHMGHRLYRRHSLSGGLYAETLKILTCGLTIGPSASKTL